ncbi:MAG: hypothetical protein M3Y42_03505 [Actinomycetota bacterium]|nr:hypothetical protein [Actinomycetota bacterium]
MYLKTKTLLAGGICTAAAAIILIPNVANATPTASSAAPSAAAAACDRGPWGQRVEGAPADFESGDRGGDYLWHDSSGFHLRVTHKNDNRVVYTGEISSPTPMRIDPVHLEHGDSAQLSADHKSLTFAFADYGHIDGVDFHTDCAPTITTTNLNAGNQKLTTDRVYLGEHKVHPAQVPFTVHRLRD